MDQITQELQKDNIGIQIEGFKNKIGSTLWVDDNTLIATNAQEFKRSLYITNEISNTYHIEYGPSNSNSLIIKGKKKRKENKEEFFLGDLKLERVEKYKLLGNVQNSKNNNDDHLKHLKGKTEAAF